MGCIGSKEATPEEKQVICKFAAKEMMLICVDPALDQADKLKISAPPDFDKVKSAAAALRKAAEDTANLPKEEAKGTGFLASVQAGITAVASVAGQGIGAVLKVLADGLDGTVGKVESPFSTIATDIVKAKKEDIAQVLCAHIIATDVPGAFDICNGSPNAISEHLIKEASKSIVVQLRPKIEEAVKAHAGLQAWNKTIESYNGACEKVGGMNMKDKLPDLASGSTIKLDIADYICEQTVLAIGKQIGEQEALVRQSPEGKAKTTPEIFEKVFTKKQLNYKDYKVVKKTQQ